MLSNKIKNIDKAAERIKKAVLEKERVILYGDSDLDGIVSVIMLEEAIKNLGGTVSIVVFPDRENDGYGINLRALDFLKDKPPALFIALDLGIGNVKETEIAKEMGFEVMIIDHHEPLGEIPTAKIIVDPKVAGENSPHRDLANAGIVFKLCEEILGNDFPEGLRNSFLELTALATVSDMVPQIGDNKIFIEEGLRSLPNTLRPGLKAFLDILGMGEIAAGGHLKIISSLNAAESKNFKNESYELLNSSSPEKCREIAENLIAKVQYKQQRIKEIAEEVERRIVQKPDEQIIFEGDPAWKLILAGTVASIIAAKYGKPTFIFKKMDAESCGSVRSLREGQNSVEAMKSCADLMITYGGHAKASGFRLKNENLEKFKNCLIDYFQMSNRPD